MTTTTAVQMPPLPEPVAWNLINPLGEVVATEENVVRCLARIQGYKPTVEGLLGFYEQGLRAVPTSTVGAVVPTAQPLSASEQMIERLAATPPPVAGDAARLDWLIRSGCLYALKQGGDTQIVFNDSDSMAAGVWVNDVLTSDVREAIDHAIASTKPEGKP